MYRNRYDDNPSNLGGQIVDWGGGGYVQGGNIDIKQEQSVHIHVHIHINDIEGEEALPEAVQSVSLLGRVLKRLLGHSKDQKLPENVKHVLPKETFNVIMDTIVEELDRVEE